MSSIPPGIFFINSDINDGIKSKLVTQLFIDEVMTDNEFDARVNVEPNYPNLIHLNQLRILVIRQNFRDYTNRDLADVVMFIKQGMVSIEKNNFGPPSLTIQIDRLTIYALLRFNNSPYVVILPPPSTPPPPFGLRGIVADEGADTSGVYIKNPDNESNNEAFKNRK